MNLQELISSNLRERRERLGLTQAKLADQAEVSVELVSRIERGRCLPSLTTLVAFAKALETSPDSLLGFAAKDTNEFAELVDTMGLLSKPRAKDVRRIAEAFVTYERRHPDPK